MSRIKYGTRTVESEIITLGLPATVQEIMEFAQAVSSRAGRAGTSLWHTVDFNPENEKEISAEFECSVSFSFPKPDNHE